jgi:hypothetical protein
VNFWEGSDLFVFSKICEGREGMEGGREERKWRGEEGGEGRGRRRRGKGWEAGKGGGSGRMGVFLLSI